MKVLVGLSGGLDSTYCVKTLLDQGHSAEGAVIVFSEHTDVKKAEISAKELGIPLRIIDLTKEFEEHVISNFIDEYIHGRTPNPCALCNRYCKVEALYRECVSGGFDAFATGHYCRIENDGERFFVKRAADTKKDQSYMLYGLTQHQLSKMLTPLADMMKSDVRANSERLAYSCAADPESMDICFIPEGKYTDFLNSRSVTSKSGNFVSPDGKIYGPHKGIMNYTVGQRKNLGIALGFRSFITKIDPISGDITLDNVNNGAVSGIKVKNVNFQKLSESDSNREWSGYVKIRYGAKPAKCRVELLGGECIVHLEENVLIPAPGQAAVFYDDDAVAFGGIIDSLIYKDQ